MEPEIKYYLKAELGGVVYYRGEFSDTADLQENGLRKAENAIERALNVED